MIRFLPVAALVMAAPALAGTAMWQNIETEMTREQVAALYPTAEQKKDRTVIKGVLILPECPASVEVYYGRGGTVSRVLVKGKASIGAACSNKVREAVIAKYGQPINKDGGENSFGQNDDEVMWNVQGLKVKFRRDETAAFRGPSWYMDYDTITAEVGL